MKDFVGRHWKKILFTGGGLAALYYGGEPGRQAFMALVSTLGLQ